MSDNGKPGGRATKRRGPSSARRKAARLAAVQALYQIDLTASAPALVLREFLQHRLGEEIDGIRLADLQQDLFAELVEGVASCAEELDDMLAAVLAEDWPVERLERLLRVILRAGAYELGYRQEAPARVVISEYVDLAHAFFSGKEPGMANGVLDRLARSLRPEEFDEGGGAPDRE